MTRKTCDERGQRHSWEGSRCVICGWTKGRDARRRAMRGAYQRGRLEALVLTADQPVGERSPFAPCPVCGSAKAARLLPEWGDGRPIPIVGCGNPWHYVGLAP